MILVSKVVLLSVHCLSRLHHSCRLRNTTAQVELAKVDARR